MSEVRGFAMVRPGSSVEGVKTRVGSSWGEGRVGVVGRAKHAGSCLLERKICRPRRAETVSQRSGLRQTPCLKALH